MLASNDRPQRSTTLRLLERLGCRPVNLDRTGGTHPFAVDAWYADCPKCGAFAGVQVEADGQHWRSACLCFGRKRLDELDLLLLVRSAA